MKVVLKDGRLDASVVCFQDENLDACLEYALMLHRSVFEPHMVSVISGIGEGARTVVSLELIERVTPKRS